jgi:hypothetical protein
VENGTEIVRIIVWHGKKECSAAVCIRHEACTGNGYIKVIGKIESYFKVKQIVAFDVCPVSSGNELTHHILEAAASWKKSLENDLNAFDVAVKNYKETIADKNSGSMKSNGK